MSEIVGGQLGPEAKYSVDLSDGKIKISVSYDGVDADASATVAIEAGLLIDRLAALIPGTVDDAIFAVLKAAFLK